MLDDDWFVRVEGKEYGPVDLETLREWKQEGRLIADNELRNGSNAAWVKASAVAELFGDSVDEKPPPVFIRRRTFAEIISETFRIYREGFFAFFSIALLVAVPSFIFQICIPYLHLGEARPASRVALTVGTLALAFFLVLWPIFLTGFQVAGAEIAAGNRIRLRALLQRAASFWPKVAKLSLIVYGSYFLWSVIPVLAIFSLVGAQPSIVSVLLALGILTLQVYMTARLWANFLFWQQTSVLETSEPLEALRESQRLARSQHEALWHERPLWRGAILVSIWLVLLIVISGLAQVPFTLVRLPDIANPSDVAPTVQGLMEKLANNPAPLWLNIASGAVATLVTALLRPLLAIAFLVLYFDAKSRL